MAQEIVNIGTGENTGDGDSNRTSWVKMNNNFTELYSDFGTLLSEVVDIQSDVDLLNSRATFTVESDDTFSVPIDTAPANMTGLTSTGTLTGVTVDTATGSVINSSGRSLNMTGTLAFQLERNSTGDVTLWFYSESSSDGISWTKNSNSLREIVVVRDGVDYKSGFSFTQSAWASGDYLRFKFGCSSASKLEFLQRSKVFEGDTVLSHSLIWNMSEH